MATAKMTASAVLGTITDTAQSISTVVKTINDSTSMLHDFVSTARIKQQMLNAATIDNLPTVVDEDIARNNVVRRKEINDWLGSSPELSGMYEAALAEVKARRAA